jgi:hypothetical protein
MEARTSVVDMHLDELRLGVKSLSSLAMAGSCRNMPQYSLMVLVSGVKVRIEFAEPQGYGTHSNSEPVNCISWEWRAVRKVLFENPNKEARS